MRNRVGVVDLNRTREAFDGHVEIALFAVNEADMGENLGVVGFAFEGGFEFAQSVGEAIEVIVDLAEFEVNDRILRVGFEDTAVETCCVFPFFERRINLAESDECVGALFVDFGNLQILIESFFKLTAMVIGFGQSESGGMVLRVEFDEAAIAVAGQFVAFADVVNIAKTGQGFAE